MGAKIEIFVDDSPLSRSVIEKVKKLACSKCEIIVYNMSDQSIVGDCEEIIKTYGIESIPTVTINGKKVDVNKFGKIKTFFLFKKGAI
jgi:hypothetical protein